MKKGIIDLGHIITIGAILASGLVGYFVNARGTDGKIGGMSERVAKLEEAVETIKKDNAETRKDIKDFLLELNKNKNARK